MVNILGSMKIFALLLSEGIMENLKIDPCLSNPCLNRGECIQLRYGQYKCECTGTNFYGEKCEKGITSAILLLILLLYRTP